jgi:Tfp pilus assembly protein PilV
MKVKWTSGCSCLRVQTETGFTLIETLMTTLILVTGLAAVAAAFSYGVETGMRVRQQTMAFALLTSKLEELKAQATLASGRYAESIGDPPMYQRTWEVSDEVPNRVTVIVFGRLPGSANTFWELARASTFVGPGF